MSVFALLDLPELRLADPELCTKGGSAAAPVSLPRQAKVGRAGGCLLLRPVRRLSKSEEPTALGGQTLRNFLKRTPGSLPDFMLEHTMTEIKR